MGLQLPDGRPHHVAGRQALKASFDKLELRGRRVLVREDLNVPMEEGRITDDTRIRAARPTLDKLSELGARTVVMSHLGRPEGKPDLDFSLRPVAEAMRVRFVTDCLKPVGDMRDGETVLLENVRFYPGDEADDPEFARGLAEHGEVYVNDAFAASHRAHASVGGVARYLPAYAGYLMLAELQALHHALDEPKRPLIAIVGGAKVSTKAGVLEHLLPRVDSLGIVGAMANTFFKARGAEVGSSLVEEEALDAARRVEREGGDKVLLPVDSVITQRVAAGAPTRVAGVDGIEPGWMIVDIGPATVELFRQRLRGAGTIVWNGPAGISEIAEFAAGTRALGEAIAASGAYSLVGGGDTAAAVEKLGLSGFSHISTGGGATLEAMEGKELPGVAVLKEEGGG
jgi:phosphoglycerate kinase